MTAVRIELPRKLIPVFQGRADVRGAYGGRGSAKTRSFAKMTAIEGMRFGMAGIRGQILCARQFMNSLGDSSLEEVKRAIEEEPFLSAYYEIGEKYICSRDGKISYSFAGLDRNISSVKSKGRILLAWVDEAEDVSDYSWTILEPTLREEGTGWNAELWVTWNPRRKGSATDLRYRRPKDPLIKIVQLNWRDNPKFPDKLERQRQRDLKERPDEYDHIWEGAYGSAQGAILGSLISAAVREGRINESCFYDPDGAPLHISSDIGFRDTASFWFWQPVVGGFKLVDYTDGNGMDADDWIEVLKERIGVRKLGKIWLPHDARAKTFQSRHSVIERFLMAFGADKCDVVPQSKKQDQINAARSIIPRCEFNVDKCERGLDGLTEWQYEWNDENQVFSREPRHDWACFHQDTMVLTRYGMRRIMELPINGEILTPCGWKQYQGPAITRKNARLVEVKFKDGYTVKCTPDHLFMTDNGWKCAESLTSDTLILSSLTRSRSISMAAYTAYGHLIHIIPEAAKSFIGKCGNQLSALFRLIATFTTRILIRPITCFGIWNASKAQNIYQCLSVRADERLPLTPWLKRGLRLLNGMLPKLGGFGINDTQKAQKHGSNGSIKTNHASIAGRWLACLSGKVDILKNIAQGRAVLLPIESVRQISETADTCCIHVPDGAWFSLANGAVVHNSHPSDAFCYGAQVMEEVVAKIKAEEAIRGVTVGNNKVTLDEMWKSVPKRSNRV